MIFICKKKKKTTKPRLNLILYENGTYSCEFLQTVSGLRPVDSSLGSLSHEAVCTLCVWLCDGRRLAKCCRAAVARNACTTAALHLRRTHRRRCAGYRLPEDAQDGIGTCPTVPGRAMARRGAGETRRGKGFFLRTHCQTNEKAPRLQPALRGPGANNYVPLPVTVT